MSGRQVAAVEVFHICVILLEGQWLWGLSWWVRRMIFATLRMTRVGVRLFCGEVLRVVVVSAGRGELYGVAGTWEVALGVENLGDSVR